MVGALEGGMQAIRFTSGMAMSVMRRWIAWTFESAAERARTVAKQTMRDVREAMGLAY